MAEGMQVKRQVLDYAAYLAVRILVGVVQALPVETCAALARRFAVLCADVIKFRRGVIDDNLRHAFPEMSNDELQTLTRRMWEHLFLLAIEVMHAPRKIHDTNWRDYTTLHNDDQLIRAF